MIVENMVLTPLQREAIGRIGDGHWHAFGSGFGRFRVSLRALHHRAPKFIEYEARDGEEYFRLSDEARAGYRTGDGNA